MSQHFKDVIIWLKLFLQANRPFPSNNLKCKNREVKLNSIHVPCKLLTFMGNNMRLSFKYVHLFTQFLNIPLPSRVISPGMIRLVKTEQR